VGDQADNAQNGKKAMPETKQGGAARRVADTDTDDVILVDTQDRPRGTAPKLAAHRTGALHRAVSAFVCNGRGELLLQRRAAEKYHSGGQWANACCSHPRPGENTATAVHRRLAEEMGVTCALHFLFTTRYRAAVSNDLTEHEFVHVFGGRHEGAVKPDPAEVEAWKWMSLPALVTDMAARPEDYAPWFRHYIAEHGNDIESWLNQAAGETVGSR
jgi:isopentenyl-diphosphate delta-isomerase